MQDMYITEMTIAIILIAILIANWYRLKWKTLSQRTETFDDISKDYSLMCQSQAEFIMYINSIIAEGKKYDVETLEHIKEYYINLPHNKEYKNV